MTFLSQNCAKIDLSLEFQKTNVGIRVNILEILCVPIFKKKPENCDFFGPNLPKNGFWGRSFKNLSPNSESPPPRYHVYQFSGKTDKFEFFGLNLKKLPNYVRFFGCYNVEGVAEGKVEAETS